MRAAITLRLLVALSALFLSCTSLASQPEETAVRDFLSAFIKRPLSQTEWQQIRAEDEGKPSKNPQQQIAMLKEMTQIMRQQAGSPRDLHLRHNFLQSYLLGGGPEKSAMGKLLLAVDPVMVVDKRAGRLMTRTDIVGFLKLFYFAETEMVPGEIGQFEDREVQGAVSTMRENIKKDGRMPEMLSEAGAFWAGIEQSWPTLDEGKRKALRKFIKRNFLAPQDTLPDVLRSKFAGWSQQEIAQAKDKSSNRNVRLWREALGIAADVEGSSSEKTGQ
jgi:hypothetical protein